MHAPTEQLAALSYQLILFAVQSGETPQAPQERADRSRENVVRRRHGNEKGTARDKTQLMEQIEANQLQEQRIADLEKITKSQLIWRIDDYNRKLKAAKSGEVDTIFSPEFYTSKNGYRLMASACLNGDGKGKGTHLSVFISVVQGEFASFCQLVATL